MSSVIQREAMSPCSDALVKCYLLLVSVGLVLPVDITAAAVAMGSLADETADVIDPGEFFFGSGHQQGHDCLVYSVVIRLAPPGLIAI